MDYEIQLFQNEQFGAVRTILIDGEPWFVGRDIALILGYSKPQNALAAHVYDEDKTTALIQGSGSNYKSNTVLINESGVYCLILSSKLPNARSFKHWVTADILPTIRKTGMYAVNDEAFIRRYAPHADVQEIALLRLTLGRIDRLNQQIEENRPKVEFADQVSDSKTLIDMNAMAKLAAHNGFPIGRNRLFSWLRLKRILMPNNIPYQEYIDRGYFELREGTYVSNGETKLSYKTLVTGKGQIYIIGKLRAEYLTDTIL